MKLALVLIYLIGSFFAFGGGMDHAKNCGERIGGYGWVVMTTLFVLALIFQ